MVDHFSAYLYQKRGFYYFSRRVPKELHHCHAKHRIVLALNTRSRAKALKYAQVICQRLDERWLPMRLDALGLGNVIANDVRAISAPTLSEATQQYLQLKGMGKAKTSIGQHYVMPEQSLRYVETELLLSIGQQTQDKCVMLLLIED